jgi:HAD superfamily hydrolase (TIGR01549 family)
VATAVILDLDGTVWDSHPFYARVAAGPSTAARKRALAELKSSASAATLLKNAGLNDRAFRGVCTAKAKLALYPGALLTIAELYEGDTPLGAATNLPAWMVDPMLARYGLDEMLSSVVTFGRTARKKPWPDPLLLCCEELEVEPDADCWYIGDSDGDCTAARRAGLSFAWASWGYSGRAPAGSTTTLSSFSDIAEL